MSKTILVTCYSEFLFGNTEVVYDGAVTACSAIGYKLGDMTAEIANLIKGKVLLTLPYASVVW